VPYHVKQCLYRAVGNEVGKQGLVNFKKDKVREGTLLRGSIREFQGVLPVSTPPQTAYFLGRLVSHNDLRFLKAPGRTGKWEKKK